MCVESKQQQRGDKKKYVINIESSKLEFLVQERKSTCMQHTHIPKYYWCTIY